jgi:hypothetical protein
MSFVTRRVRKVDTAIPQMEQWMGQCRTSVINTHIETYWSLNCDSLGRVSFHGLFRVLVTTG